MSAPGIRPRESDVHICVVCKAPSRIGATRVGGVDLNKPRIRAALAALLALAPAPGGFTVGCFRTQVRAMTGQGDTDYTIRQAAYDLRTLRAKDLVEKPDRSRRYHVPQTAARTIAALVVVRDQVIDPILAGVRSPRQGRKPTHWTRLDRDYETIRVDIHRRLLRPRHLCPCHRRIDNILSMRFPQAASSAPVV